MAYPAFPVNAHTPPFRYLVAWLTIVSCCRWLRVSLVCTLSYRCTLLVRYPCCIVFWIGDFVQVVLGVFVVASLCFGRVLEPVVL